MSTGICRLCKEERDLQRSHIIPELMWGLMYSSSHRIVVVPSPERGRPHKVQKGFRECLLCRKCEGHIGRWETYASRVFFDEERYKPAVTTRHKYLLRDVDYKKFKLFLMSILWRAGISTLETFEQVNLGPHAERLRSMLLASDPGEPGDYPCLIILPESIPEFIARAIWPPLPFRAYGARCYRFIIGGYLWCFVVARHSRALVSDASVEALKEAHERRLPDG